ncbi:class F sortase [Kitasatospora viridis]|uniref:Sortase family protein n=1 Tax=Kitasatospora viridis TaxID=281105 RepID=A0A561UNQ1_9ACTN|nr:class F sortase [Kitasatospora viridis]TWG00993.1 sortase family protein [Kitasatospora viridis]
MSPKVPHDGDPAPFNEKLSRRRRNALFAALLSCLLGLVLIHRSADPRPALPPRQPTAAQAAAASPSAQAKRTVPAVAVPDARPTRLSIPAIGVTAPFTGLSLGSNGVLNAPPPDDTNLVGWYQGGTVPGNKGPAIVLGHVDTQTAPAVFWGLSTLTQGATVDIDRDDLVTATFTVDSVEVFAKDAFPDDRVYGPTQDAQLRLITCGGAYDRQRGDYTANVVVFAHLSGLRET